MISLLVVINKIISLIPKIVKCLETGGVIPVLAMIKGGTEDKPNFGLLARAMTDAVKF